MLALIDWLLHGMELFIKHGLTTTTILGLAIFGIRQTIKNRKIQRRVRKLVPWLIPDDESEVKSYVANQQRIEMKVDLLLQERGIEWHVITLNESSSRSAMKSASVLESHSATNIIVQHVGRSTKLRRVKLMNKFKSRKFWMAVITGILIVLNDGLDLGIDQDTVLAFAGIMATFILGEAGVDALRTKSTAKQEEDHSNFSH